MPLTVLLLADHPGVRAALAERLAPPGTPWVVQTAATLKDAVQAVQQSAPAVLLYVPARSTRAAPAEVQQLSQRGVPVVVLAPTLGAGEEDALRQAGADAVLLQGLPLPTVRDALARVAALEEADVDEAG